MGSLKLPIFMAPAYPLSTLMKYRNFKIIYKNITLKKNVVFINAYNFNEALTIASAPLKKMGYQEEASIIIEKRERVYEFDVANSWVPWNQFRRHARVRLEIVNLHQSRTRK